jgi:hypothetical protein
VPALTFADHCQCCCAGSLQSTTSKRTPTLLLNFFDIWAFHIGRSIVVHPGGCRGFPARGQGTRPFKSSNAPPVAARAAGFARPVNPSPDARSIMTGCGNGPNDASILCRTRR